MDPVPVKEKTKKQKSGAKGKHSKSHKKGHIRVVKGAVNPSAKYDNSMRNHCLPRGHDQTSALRKMVQERVNKQCHISSGYMLTLSAVMHAIINEVGVQLRKHTPSVGTIKLPQIKAVLGTLLLNTELQKDAVSAAQDKYEAVRKKSQKSKGKKKSPVQKV